MSTNITDEQLAHILSLEESHFGDLKGKEIKPAKLTVTVSALANAAGGEIFLGVEERTIGDKKVREWRGFADEEAANAHIQTIHNIAPLADFIDMEFLRHEKSPGVVLKVELQKNGSITKTRDGAVYVRKGSQNLQVSTDEGMQRLRLDKGVDSYEEYSIATDLADVESSETISEFLGSVIPTALPNHWLTKQKLIREEKPTVAAVLLFMDEPQVVLPKRSAIKILKYSTTDKVGTREQLAFDPGTVEGSIYRLIYGAVQRTQAIIEETSKINRSGLSDIEYPPETLHEIIANAVLHRDYSIATDIQVRIYDNRVEVESPGRLAGHVTQANILDSQYARNQRIVRLINKFPNPPNKDVGEGLNTAFEAMRKLRLKSPTIIELADSVLIVIPHERLASPEDIVLEYLERNDEIANRTARRLCGIDSENTMKAVFKRLQARGLLEPVPGRSRFQFAWRLPKSES